jgi:predicted metal-dependent HD superfamily phosphohydrolase
MQSRWIKTWQRLGVDAPDGAFAQLNARYFESHRKYHTLQHLAECFALYDSLTTAPKNESAVELAIWFHDAVYDNGAANNEEASAAVANQTLAGTGLPLSLVDRVCHLILATRHETAGDSSLEEMVLLDVDLSILVAAPSRFFEFESQIRAEYSWVAESQFCAGRAAILKRFLARSPIYQLPLIRTKLEDSARRNLVAAIERLEG